jgi:hypothetical protein
LLDCKTHKLHVFNGQTGQYLGVAFSGVKGKNLRPAVLLCHRGSTARAVTKTEASASAPKAVPGSQPVVAIAAPQGQGNS